MFTKQNATAEALQGQIRTLVLELENHETLSKEYGETLDRIDRLQKQISVETKHRPRISPDTMVLAATNLIGIVMITRYEKENVITSKATGFVQKLNKPKP